MSGPIPKAATRSGAAVLVSLLRWRLWILISSWSSSPPSSEGPQHVAHRRPRVGHVAVSGEGGAGGDELEVGERLEVGAQLIRRGHEGGLEGDHGCGVSFHRRVPGDLHEPDRLNNPVGQLRGRRRFAGEDLPGGVLGVDRVALARQAPLSLAGRAAHLDHLQTVAAEVAGEAAPVGPGPLDPERCDRSERARPGDHLLVAGRVGDEREVAEAAAETVDGDSDVFVFVGVDADDDVAPAERDAGHGCWSPQLVNGHLAGRAGGQDCEGTVAIRLL